MFRVLFWSGIYILTLGLIDGEIVYDDGVKITLKSWLRLFHKKKKSEPNPLKGAVKAAIQTLDEKGRKNVEGNSLMLWEKEWDSMRNSLWTALEDSK